MLSETLNALEQLDLARFDTVDYGEIPKGDMPGDKIAIDEGHIVKAKRIFPKVVEQIKERYDEKGQQKFVLSVHGGSGVGKSEIGSLLGYYLSQGGLKTYVLSGDNYPRRLPKYNDAERLRLYRKGGMWALQEHGLLTDEVLQRITHLQEVDQDADKALQQQFPWLITYQTGARRALGEYLGSREEIDFDEVNGILSDFKSGAASLQLKRMGRMEHELWYETIPTEEIDVLVIEWTHGNNKNLTGVDIPILLNSTPEETLAHRRQRNRDKGVDSPFTMTVLELEQQLLMAEAHRAAIIMAKSGELLSYEEWLETVHSSKQTIKPILNLYPDSIGGNLSGLSQWIESEAVRGAFGGVYLLPSIFHSDLDRGFSIIDYGLNSRYATVDDMHYLAELGLSYKFDMVLNHASVLSPQFQDILKKGEASKYMDFFIPWNRFWDGYGAMSSEGYIQPEEAYIKDMFFRKPGLPILQVMMPNGQKVPFWNTFYQEKQYRVPTVTQLMDGAGVQYSQAMKWISFIEEELQAGKEPDAFDWMEEERPIYEAKLRDILYRDALYLGQMDLNVKSPLVWTYYENTLRQLSAYGAEIVRLDAFAYSSKEPGKRNFFNEPETWEILHRLNGIAKRYEITLLPEIHARYEEGLHEKIAKAGYMIYDFFLPGLLLDAFERRSFVHLKTWIHEILDKGYRTVNMLGCHDGIPLLDLKGLLEDQAIEQLIDVVVGRGGKVKDLHGKKNIYYQVNATYYSALGEDSKRMTIARAIQLFMPGKPQIWYLDIVNGKNNHEAVELAGSGGHKEINRTNLTLEEALMYVEEPEVKEQLELIRLRQQHPAFHEEATVEIMDTLDDRLKIRWTYGEHRIMLSVNLREQTMEITE